MSVTIWRFTDGKPGHDSQSKGLCAAIEKLKDCKRFDISIDPLHKNISNLLLKRFPAGKNLPDPDLIIGAGHGSHLPMLAARHARKGKIIVLMKPSLPLSLFDLCLIPKHDSPPDHDNVITTTGALNPIQFNKNKESNKGLILLGGPSRHFYWNNDSIIEQLDNILSDNTNLAWTIANSPRTPAEAFMVIQKKGFNNVEFLSYKNTNTNKLHELIYKSQTIWVSADSISMIYESLTSGADVGLLEVKEKAESRINNAIKQLIKSGQLTAYSAWEKTKSLKYSGGALNEAERCSGLLLERGMLN